MTLALAGCAGGEEEPSSEETGTEESSSVCTGDTFDCTEEFAQTVLSELEESGNTPEPIDAGVYKTEEGEAEPGTAMVFAAFDLTNETTLGRQIGNMVFGPMYENWPDYPDTDRFWFRVFPTTDAEDFRTDMYVERWWIEGLRDGDFTTDEIADNILDTSTQPLSGVVN